MRPFCVLAVTLVALVSHAGGEAPEEPQHRRLIDFTNREGVGARRPLLIAHRGGVVTPNSPECSLAAIRLAAQHGYDMVELDVQESRDQIPLVFHDRTLKSAVGDDRAIADVPASEVVQLRFRGNNEPIATLDEALLLCKSLSLGVMLDIKNAGLACLERTADLVRKHGLTRSTVTISGDPLVQEHLRPVSRVRLTEARQAHAVAGDRLDGYFWFGLPKDLPLEKISAWQEAGALVFPAINTFRYPAANHRALAAEDIRKLQAAGIDGFQIDSVYEDLIARPARSK